MLCTFQSIYAYRYIVDTVYIIFTQDIRLNHTLRLLDSSSLITWYHLTVCQCRKLYILYLSVF